MKLFGQSLKINGQDRRFHLHNSILTRAKDCPIMIPSLPSRENIMAAYDLNPMIQVEVDDFVIIDSDGDFMFGNDYEEVYEIPNPYRGGDFILIPGDVDFTPDISKAIRFQQDYLARHVAETFYVGMTLQVIPVPSGRFVSVPAYRNSELHSFREALGGE